MSFIVPFPGDSRVTCSFASAAIINTGIVSSHTFTGLSLGGESADRRTAVCVTLSANGQAVTTGCNVNGVATTQLFTGNLGQSNLFIIDSPVGGTGNIQVVTTGGNGFVVVAVSVFALYGSGSQTPFDIKSNSVNTSPQTVALNIPANGAAIAYASFRGTASWTNLTERADMTVVLGSISASHTSASDEFPAAQTGLSVQCAYTIVSGPFLVAASWGR